MTIAVLNWNGREDTAQCLESLMRLDYEPLQILVLDNGSTDGSVEYLLGRFPSVTIVENGANLGFSGGNNVGIRRAMADGADYVMLLNNDATMAPGALTRLVAAGEADPKIGILGPKTFSMEHPEYIYSTGMTWHARIGYSELNGIGEKDRGQFELSCERDAVGGHAFLIKRQVIEAIGELDTDYFIYYEETDYCLRARKAGFKCWYVADSIVWHRGHSSNASRSRVYLLQRNQILCVRKNEDALTRLAFFAYFLLYRFPKVVLTLLVLGKREELDLTVRAVLWHIAFFQRANPLAQILAKNKR